MAYQKVILKLKFHQNLTILNYFSEINHPKLVQFMDKFYPPGFAYQDFARDFTAEFYDPEEWAELFQSSGAK